MEAGSLLENDDDGRLAGAKFALKSKKLKMIWDRKEGTVRGPTKKDNPP